jgi:hypothetical protein
MLKDPEKGLPVRKVEAMLLICDLCELWDKHWAGMHLHTLRHVTSKQGTAA